MPHAFQPLRSRAATTVCAATLISLSLFCFSCSKETPFQSRDGEMVLFTGGAAFKGFDPVTAGDVATANHVSNVYEGLLEYHYLKRPYTVVPVLCEEVPTVENGGVSADGLTYTFKIKRGVYFHDDPCFPDGKGREINAHDFVYSFKRNLDAALDLQGDWVYKDHVLGAQQFMDLAARYHDPLDPSRKKLYAVNVPGFQALDDRTFQIKLSQPYPQLLWVLTMPYGFVVPHEAVEYYDGAKHAGERAPRPLFRNRPVGTGPWILKEWRFGYKVEYVRNPKYKHMTYPTEGEEIVEEVRQPDGTVTKQIRKVDLEAGLLKDAGRALPICDRMIAYDIREPAAAWRLFLTGDLASSGISRDYFDKVVTTNLDLTPDLQARGIRLFKRAQMFTLYTGINFNDPVMGRGETPEQSEKNKKLRQAVACALDQERLIKVLVNGRAIPATGPVPPGVPGHLKPPYAFAYNPERAKQLLAEAGYPDGKGPDGKRLRLTLENGSAGSTDARQSAELHKEMLAAIGIDLEVRSWSWTEFLRRAKSGSVQMFQLGWVIDYPDAQNFLQLFYGPNKSPGPNSTNYQNDEFDKLYQQIISMPDSPERTEIYERMSRIVVDDVAWIMGNYPLVFGLVQGWYENYKPHDFGGPNAKFIRIGK
jgi:ABC-type transport system substrate-binding protein